MSAVKQEIKDVKVRLSSLKVDIIQWGVIMLLAQAMLIVALTKYFRLV